MLTSAYDDIEYKGHVKAGAETGLKRWLLGAAYEYPLSKRTHLTAPPTGPRLGSL